MSSSTCAVLVPEGADFARPPPGLECSHRAYFIDGLTNFLRHTELLSGYATTHLLLPFLCSHAHTTFEYLFWLSLKCVLQRLSKLTNKLLNTSLLTKYMTLIACLKLKVN